MKKFTVLASTISVALLAALLGGCDAKTSTVVDKPDDKTAVKTQEELIKEGEKLATRGECMTCHSPIRMVDGVMGPDFKNALGVGGNAWLTPGAGIGVAPNLTTAGKFLTGEVDEIVDAWIASDKQYLPPMPQIGKTYSKDELTAIVTYLKSIPAKSEDIPETYYFAGKTAGDKTWPAPGWMKDPQSPAYVGAEHTGKVIPGMLEISIAPFAFQQFGQTLIDANINFVTPPAE